jgi:hypothetical protein
MLWDAFQASARSAIRDKPRGRILLELMLSPSVSDGMRTYDGIPLEWAENDDVVRVLVLLHREAPLVAFVALSATASPRILEGSYEPIDHPSLVQFFAPARVLSRAELTQPFHPNGAATVEGLLGVPLDVNDLDYWNPTTLCEALFNFWD